MILRYNDYVTVHLFGVNHNTARTDLRERLAVAEPRIPRLLAGPWLTVDEVAALSTCNRIEMYAVSEDNVVPELVERLAEYTRLPVSEISAHGYEMHGGDAVHHLISVAAGLDSVVVGEPQVLGQVRQAWDIAREAGALGPTLNTLFRYALEAGKEVRSRTVIARGATSVAHAAVEIARKELRDLSGRRVLVLGAGETGRLAALNLLDAGVGSLSIANRTWERAQALAAELHGTAVAFDALPEALRLTDVLITCSTSEKPLVTAQALGDAGAERDGSPLLVIDIAVPRNVEADARYLPGVSLFDMDDLQSLCEHNKHARLMAARRAERDIQEWADRFASWERERKAVPVVSALRGRAEELRERELRKAMRSLGDLSEREANAVRAMSKAIVNGLLHDPTIWLKEESTEEQRELLAEAFGLNADQRKGRRADADSS